LLRDEEAGREHLGSIENVPGFKELTKGDKAKVKKAMKEAKDPPKKSAKEKQAEKEKKAKERAEAIQKFNAQLSKEAAMRQALKNFAAKRADAEDRLINFYDRYEPSKLQQDGFVVEMILDRYVGNYDTLFQRLTAKYGPEDDDESDEEDEEEGKAATSKKREADADAKKEDEPAAPAKKAKPSAKSGQSKQPEARMPDDDE
jgi:hypothetical protein